MGARHWCYFAYVLFGWYIAHSSPSLFSLYNCGNGQSIPILSCGTSALPTADASFSINNVLVTPTLVCNLLLVHQFTHNNHSSVKFDALGFSIKNLYTGQVIHRCNSDGDLYFPHYTWPCDCPCQPSSSCRQPSGITTSAILVLMLSRPYKICRLNQITLCVMHVS